MTKILAFDISSTTIGWALIEVQDKSFSLSDYGHIKPKKKKGKEKYSMSKSLALTYESIQELIKDKNPDDIVVEKYATRFSMGRSTANTIIVLSVYNELVSLVAYKEFEKETTKLAPATIRSKISKYYDIKIEGKDGAFKFVDENISNFKTKLNRLSNIKKECYDEADAICVGICHFIINYS